MKRFPSWGWFQTFLTSGWSGDEGGEPLRPPKEQILIGLNRLWGRHLEKVVVSCYHVLSAVFSMKKQTAECLRANRFTRLR